jgi:hypothetical protein
MAYKPFERLTKGQKIKRYGSIENWAKQILDVYSYPSKFPGNFDDKARIFENYELALGKFDPKKFVSYTGIEFKEENVNYKFPVDLNHYDVVTPKLNLLLGEYVARPFRWMCVSSNPDSVSAIEKEKIDAVKALFLKTMAESLQIEDKVVPESQFETLEEIETYFAYDYVDAFSKEANGLLDYLSQRNDLPSLFVRGFFDFLVSGYEIYKVEKVDKDVKVRKVDPRLVEFDCHDDVVYIEECDWVRETRYMSMSEIYDEYYDWLSEKDRKELEKFAEGVVSEISIFGYDRIGDGKIEVVTMEWKSLVKVGLATMIDEFGNVFSMVVEEDFKKTENVVSLEWKWITEVWEGTRIGKDVYVKIRRKPDAVRTMSNLSECKLGYVGVYVRYCFLDKLKEYQYLFDVVMYKLKLALATSVGQALLMDLAQIPMSLGFDLHKWLYFLKQKLVFINSTEQAFKPSSVFNQFQAIDLTARSEILSYIEILRFLDDRIGEISGVTRERQGDVQRTETFGGIERSVTQSSYITEVYFNYHSQAKKRVLTHMIETAKFVVREGDSFQYVVSDFGRQIVTLSENFLLSDYSIFVANDKKNFELLKTLRETASAALQAGVLSFKGLVDILSSDDVATVKNLIKLEERKIQRMRAEEAEAQRQNAQMQLEAQMRAEQAKLQLSAESERAKLEVEAKIKEREFALKTEETKIKTELETAKLELQSRLETERLQLEKSLKEFELEKLRMETAKMELEAEKLGLQAELEKEKMEHEKLKAELEKDRLNLESGKLALEGEKHLDEKQLKIKELEIKKEDVTKNVEKARLELEMKKIDLEIKNLEFKIKQAQLENQHD